MHGVREGPFPLCSNNVIIPSQPRSSFVHGLCVFISLQQEWPRYCHFLLQLKGSDSDPCPRHSSCGAGGCVLNSFPNKTADVLGIIHQVATIGLLCSAPVADEGHLPWQMKL